MLTNRQSRLPRALLLALLAAVLHAPAVLAINFSNGQALYQSGPPSVGYGCATTGCHGPNPLLNQNSIRAGANNPDYIAMLIAQSRGGMGIYQGKFSSADLADIAAYIATPGGVTTITTTAATTTTTSATTSTTLPAIGAVAGWNLLGNGSSTAWDVATLFGNTANVVSVWKWLPGSAMTWAFYSPVLSAEQLSTYAASKGYTVLTSVGPGEGVWVNAQQAFSITPPAVSVLASVTVATLAPSGWSLVAAGDGSTPGQFHAATATNPAGRVVTLWAWSASVSQWYFYAPSLEASGGLAAYIQSKGYLDFTAAAKRLDHGTGFWVNLAP